MPFSTPIFLFAFLPLTLALHTFLPHRLRNLVLLLASLVFYAWGEPRVVWVMLLSIAANWAFGLGIAKAREVTQKKVVLGCAIASTSACWVGSSTRTSSAESSRGSVSR